MEGAEGDITSGGIVQSCPHTPQVYAVREPQALGLVHERCTEQLWMLQNTHTHFQTTCKLQVFNECFQSEQVEGTTLFSLSLQILNGKVCLCKQ
jgi:hypothetical protein